MGYSVLLLAGEVEIRAPDHTPALLAVKELDRTRDDLKGGWHRGPDRDRIPHWSFADPEIQAIDDLVEMLRAFRFEPLVSAETGDIEGVELIGRVRSRGDELHLWSVLAGFVRPGGRLDWYGEDEAVERWRFDGKQLNVVAGSLRFEDSNDDWG